MPQNAVMVDLTLPFGAEEAPLTFAPGVVWLPGFASPYAAAVFAGLELIERAAPFRHMQTRGGSRMSVAMTSCGTAGWTSDRSGYRYRAEDPSTGAPWPPMPQALRDLARRAAEAAGYPDFEPDACLVNRYDIGARMGLHQDRDERDLTQPVVSASFGLPATFLFGGERRRDAVRRIALRDGDVVVWGGASRLAFHGIAPLREGPPTAIGQRRINLTFRRAL